VLIPAPNWYAFTLDSTGTDTFRASTLDSPTVNLMNNLSVGSKVYYGVGTASSGGALNSTRGARPLDLGRPANGGIRVGNLKATQFKRNHFFGCTFSRPLCAACPTVLRAREGEASPVCCLFEDAQGWTHSGKPTD
jgi:hypothetical protein